jgi:hypothetical protein
VIVAAAKGRRLLHDHKSRVGQVPEDTVVGGVVVISLRATSTARAASIDAIARQVVQAAATRPSAFTRLDQKLRYHERKLRRMRGERRPGRKAEETDSTRLIEPISKECF